MMVPPYYKIIKTHIMKCTSFLVVKKDLFHCNLSDIRIINNSKLFVNTENNLSKSLWFISCSPEVVLWFVNWGYTPSFGTQEIHIVTCSPSVSIDSSKKNHPRTMTHTKGACSVPLLSSWEKQLGCTLKRTISIIIFTRIFFKCPAHLKGRTRYLLKVKRTKV